MGGASAGRREAQPTVEALSGLAAVWRGVVAGLARDHSTPGGLKKCLIATVGFAQPLHGFAPPTAMFLPPLTRLASRAAGSSRFNRPLCMKERFKTNPLGEQSIPFLYLF